MAGQRGSLELGYQSTDHHRIKLNRDWDALIKTAQLRSSIAGILLQSIIGKIPEATTPSAEILVEFSLDDLVTALRQDMFLAGEVKNELASLYPNDQATGFKEGDLRGWFWVNVPE